VLEGLSFRLQHEERLEADPRGLAPRRQRSDRSDRTLEIRVSEPVPWGEPVVGAKAVDPAAFPGRRKRARAIEDDSKAAAPEDPA
jgi:hypothetical protein